MILVGTATSGDQMSSADDPPAQPRRRVKPQPEPRRFIGVTLYLEDLEDLVSELASLPGDEVRWTVRTDLFEASSLDRLIEAEDEGRAVDEFLLASRDEAELFADEGVGVRLSDGVLTISTDSFGSPSPATVGVFHRVCAILEKRERPWPARWNRWGLGLLVPPSRVVLAYERHVDSFWDRHREAIALHGINAVVSGLVGFLLGFLLGRV